MTELVINLEFAGGAELLFDKVKKRRLELPALSSWLPSAKSGEWRLGHLLLWLERHLLTERPELFLQTGSVRPGILVLINDTDWELHGQRDYEIQQGDSILFISTLHGG